MSEAYPIFDDIEHALTKTKDSGIFERVENIDLRCISPEGNLYSPKFLHSPCLLTILNEPIVNCSDACIKGFGVKSIYVYVDKETGIITIYNDGKGIDIIQHDQGTDMLGRKVYVPEVVFTNFRCGSNLKTAKDHAVGGTNGFGIKLTNVHSDWLELQTVDARRKKRFSQRYQLAKHIIEEPVIEDYKQSSYTQLRFLPTYTRLDYGKCPKPEELEELIDILRYKLYLLSTFLSFKKVKVYLNDELIPCHTTKELINIIEPSDAKTYSLKASDSDGKFIDISVKVRTGKSITATMVNGTSVGGGSHITHLTRRVNKELKDLAKDKDKVLKCESYMSIACVAWLVVHNWGDQVKSKLELKESAMKEYKFDDRKITQIAKEIIDASKMIDIRKTIKTKIDKKVLYEKYTPAKKLGKTNTTLFLAEGDSAMLLLQRGISLGHGTYTIDNTGIFSLGGVPMNIGKTITEHIDEEGDEIDIASQKFYESKTFGALVQTLKLDPMKKYKTKEEIKSLAYDKVVICVDQDLDGRGNICSLVLQMFQLLWPNLLTVHNFVYHWNSPILRVLTTKGKLVKEFKYECEYERWIKSDDVPNNIDKPIYIKGLAGHDDKFIKGMFERFDDDIICMKGDEDTKKQFNIYFGKDSKTRKTVLSIPVEHFDEEEIIDMEDRKQLLCQRHLEIDTKEFMIYAMKRTITALDGMTPVRRKALTLMIRHSMTKAMKVFQVTGRVAYEMLYHHGDASMNNAIIKMSQCFPGSNNYPLLCKDGQTGSRNCRGKDAGSPRYVGVFLNVPIVNALFPKDDIPILSKKFDDGTEVEPEFFIPPLPLPILELNKSVSYAWCLLNYPRDLDSVCDILVKLCKSEAITDEEKLIPPSTRNYRGKVYIEDGVVRMEGVYKLHKDGKTIDITELPLTITPKKYALSMLDDSTNVVNVRNSTTDNIDISIELKAGVIDKIRKKYKDATDPIAEFLKINATMNENFNYINENGVIEHFDTAYAVLKRCFKLNKRKYLAKITREILLLTYMIMREENIIKFIEVDEIEKLKHKTHEVIDSILSKDKFRRINTTAINTQAKYTTDELKEELENDSKSSYGYLTSIRVVDVSKEELDKRNKKLQEYKDRLDELNKMLKEKPFAGAKQYIEDIENCRRILSS